MLNSFCIRKVLLGIFHDQQFCCPFATQFGSPRVLFRDFLYSTPFACVYFDYDPVPIKGLGQLLNGEGGIRTLVRSCLCNSLAGSRFQPLSHLSSGGDSSKWWACGQTSTRASRCLKPHRISRGIDPHWSPSFASLFRGPRLCLVASRCPPHPALVHRWHPVGADPW